MGYFRNLDTKLKDMTDLFKKKDERLLILINADPDALASAMALKRILYRKVQSVAIAHVNDISRPDNLAMIKLLRIPTLKLTPPLIAQYDKFALVDSQPHHHPDFEKLKFSIVLDHHPLNKDKPVEADYKEINPDYGSNSSLLTEYLYNLNIRPGKLLATALLYGIKTDTQSFERKFHDVDIRAFRYLTKFYNPLLLQKIVRSEFHKEWLKYFSLAFRKIKLLGQGSSVFMGKVESPDILVILADFFLRIHNISWDMVSGLHDDSLVVIFRGDGLRKDMGKMASQMFSDLGPAGGHKQMARAEIPIEKIDKTHAHQFILSRLADYNHKRKAKGKQNSANGVSALGDQESA
ncbi:DHH family phosphoesterase [Desulfonatronovibrio magnus]|uniref:DHH family phosphoesterase n=1 Tax=Desulfonatronovibrio magnus TaxID=698827 RepID=UPI0005EBB33E|nr:DHH family phosphoesterase [Desulfonatronovibrio magnus]RQD65477.1 MAG: phosphoesterase [Desulfonatronovibrio sp. MSAO_Bac4]